MKHFAILILSLAIFISCSQTANRDDANLTENETNSNSSTHFRTVLTKLEDGVKLSSQVFELWEEGKIEIYFGDTLGDRKMYPDSLIDILTNENGSKYYDTTKIGVFQLNARMFFKGADSVVTDRSFKFNPKFISSISYEGVYTNCNELQKINRISFSYTNWINPEAIGKELYFSCKPSDLEKNDIDLVEHIKELEMKNYNQFLEAPDIIIL